MDVFEYEENLEFDFFGVENACRLEPCENGGTCVFAPGLEPPYGKGLALGTSCILPGVTLNPEFGFVTILRARWEYFHAPFLACKSLFRKYKAQI